MHHASYSANPSGSNRPSILGIWRLGDVIHAGETAELCLAQPADAVGSPRWDYILKRGLGVEQNVESRRQIERCTLAASASSHPNLIAVLDASVVGSSPHVVMPRLDGTSMSEHLDVNDSVALPVALWWTRQAAQGLAALHAAGWVHQDVKPDNIMVAPRGHVTLIDLGFAARIGEHSAQTFRGSVQYASPEALAATDAIEPARDIFSLGRVLWSWMTKVEAASDRLLSPIAELVEQMVAEQPHERPTADWVSRQLLRLEIESLGRHIGPTQQVRRAA